MAASLEALSSGKLHVGTVASQQIMGSPVSLSSIIPGTFTSSGPAYIGQCLGGDIANAALSVGPRLVPTGLFGIGVPTPGIASLMVLGAPMAIQATGGVNVIGLFNVSGIATKAGADVKASVSTTGGVTVEASSTANGRNNATAGAITCARIEAGFGAFTSVAAPFKQFDIPHPTRGEGWRLAHAALEGPEMGVYYRGKTREKIIELPHYWTGLVHEDSITVQLTPIGKACSTLHFKKIEDNKVYIGHQASELEYFYIIHGERKDLGDLIIEYKGESVKDFVDSEEKIKRNGEVIIDNGHKGLAPLPLNPLGN